MEVMQLIIAGCQIIAFIGGAFFVIGKIQTTTAVLGNTISSLGKSVDKLETAVVDLDKKIDLHGERIAVLEGTSR